MVGISIVETWANGTEIIGFSIPILGSCENVGGSCAAVFTLEHSRMINFK